MVRERERCLCLKNKQNSLALLWPSTATARVGSCRRCTWGKFEFLVISHTGFWAVLDSAEWFYFLNRTTLWQKTKDDIKENQTSNWTPTSQTSQLHVRPQTVRVRAHGGNKYTLKNTDLKINKYIIDLALFQCAAHFSHSEQIILYFYFMQDIGIFIYYLYLYYWSYWAIFCNVMYYLM